MEVAVRPFHCGLAVNVQRNYYTLSWVVIATCIFTRPTPAVDNDEVILKSLLRVFMLFFRDVVCIFGRTAFSFLKIVWPNST